MLRSWGCRMWDEIPLIYDTVGESKKKPIKYQNRKKQPKLKLKVCHDGSNHKDIGKSPQKQYEQRKQPWEKRMYT